MRNTLNSATLSDLSRLVIGGEVIQKQIANLANTIGQSAGGSKFPPYNAIRIDRDTFAIEVALAGYKRDEISITTQDRKLVISSEKEPQTEVEVIVDRLTEAPEEVVAQVEHTRPSNLYSYLHRGIAKRDFELSFNIGPYVEVTEAKLEDGILTVGLKQNLPDNLKPRTIPIS